MTDPSVLSLLAAPILGFLIGIMCRLIGLTPVNATYRASFGDDRFLNTLWLAAALSIALTHALAALDMVSLSASIHASTLLPWTGLVFGSILLGVGMALARTDIFAATMEASRGHLPSIAVFLIIALVTLAGSDGPLRPVIDIVRERAMVDVSGLGLPSVALGPLLVHLTGQDPFLINGGLATGGTILFLYILIARGLWRKPLLLLTSLVLGSALPLLWATAEVTSGLPYLLLEPSRMVASFMGIPGISVGPLSLMIIGVLVGCGVLFAVPSRTPQPEAPPVWRVLLGTIAMGIGGVMATGDLLSHAAVGLAGLALPSIGCVVIMILVATNTAKMLDT